MTVTIPAQPSPSQPENKKPAIGCGCAIILLLLFPKALPVLLILWLLGVIG